MKHVTLEPGDILDQLTDRERLVLAWVGCDLSVPEIAEKLNKSPRTVEKQLEAVKKKTGLRRIAGLAVLSYRLGLHREVQPGVREPACCCGGCEPAAAE